jgi:YgiT-type zinc finger domain-containing protein
MSDQEKKNPVYHDLCTECQTGVLRLEYITYFTWLNEELVTVPNFPAWVCDVCGKREYDGQAVTWLNTLLSHEMGGHRPHFRRRRPGAARANQSPT